MVADTVGALIEEAVNGVEGMIYMSLRGSSAGLYTLTVTFAPGTNPDIVRINVQNRVQIATPRLPGQVAQQSVTVRAGLPDFLLATAFFPAEGSELNPLQVSDYVGTIVADSVARVEGVGEASSTGTADHAIRIWLDPRRMAALSLTPQEVAAAIARQNVQALLSQAGSATCRRTFSTSMCAMRRDGWSRSGRPRTSRRCSALVP